MGLRRLFKKHLGKRSTSAAKPRPLEPGGSSRLVDVPLDPGPPLEDSELPRVAVVILNYNGRRHLEGCFGSLLELDYPKELLEVILIDNGSDDDSVEIMGEHHAWARLIVNEQNVGFSAGCNQGARAAKDAEVFVS